jgi:hypothetical protein
MVENPVESNCENNRKNQDALTAILLEGVIVFHAGDIASDHARALFDIALGEILFFAECAKRSPIIMAELFH